MCKGIAGILFILLIFSLGHAENTRPEDPAKTQDCRNIVCGPAYEIVHQPNGACFCVLKDCVHIQGCPPPPSVREDCPSVSGCPVPPPETKGP